MECQRRRLSPVPDFYDLLKAYSAPQVFNPWRDWDPLDEDWAPFSAVYRMKRLRQHFACQPDFILIGEAPGYQGCHFSGVPFTSEALLMTGTIPRIQATGRITKRANPWSEPSATIVWGTLRNLGIQERTIMWNAFPFHPYDGLLHSNRTPKAHELDIGKDFCRRILESAPGAKVVAVGQKAAGVLKHIGVTPDACVRHPSMGGARQFAEGMRAVNGPSAHE